MAAALILRVMGSTLAPVTREKAVFVTSALSHETERDHNLVKIRRGFAR